MPVDFASALKDFESWKISYMRKTPGAKDRLSRMVMIRHSGLQDVIQNELASGNQRYVFVGKCSAERGFNGIMADSIPKTNQYQQVKDSVSLYQTYIVDLDTVPDCDLGCTEDAVLTRLAASSSAPLNTVPQRNRYVYLVLFANDSLDAGNVPAPAPSRPTTAPSAAPPGRAPQAAKLVNATQPRPSTTAPSRQQTPQQTTSTVAAPSRQLTQTQTQKNGTYGTDAKRPNTVTIVTPNKPAAPAKPQPAAVQQTIKVQNGKPMQTTQANSRPGTAPLNATTLKQPNRR